MKDKRSDLAIDIVENAIFRMEESLRMISKSTALLSTEELWKKPNRASNSVGNIIIHLKGNITQYILAGLGGQEDRRQRDLEFSVTHSYSAKELNHMLQELMEEVKTVLYGLKDKELIKSHSVQGFKLSGQGIVLHVVEHLSYHTGQIAFWTKILKNKDLGFYEGFDLNTKNDK
ncbi:DinB family protein [uncultured Muriicola sp.]|uniref:DinB family protein n=1 Tax=uncultured Muriicola sp. TaxID=1583102 RepID=UPI00262F83F3|nr:DinB family protein [uncultured Muriicola sp.]